MKRFTTTSAFVVLALIMGAAAGAVVFLMLKVMNGGIHLLWEYIPERTGLSDSLAYTLAVCLAGGLIIGLWQKRHGVLPDDLEHVMGRIRSEGAYPYDRIHILIVSALLPLVFGGTLGPEAGLTGIIAGICFFIGDHLKYRADKAAALAEAGAAAVLGAVFGAPLFGIAANLEKTRKSDRKRLVSKPVRTLIYISSVCGAVLSMAGLGHLMGGGGGIPRFDPHHATGPDQWKWFPVLFICGIVLALFYLAVKKATDSLADRIRDRRVVSCLLAGLILGLAGHFLPLTMFSGEHQMGELIESGMDMGAAVLILSALGKIFLVNVCISFGWRGGSIFPLIFAGAAAGYAFASVLGMDGPVAVAVIASSLYAYIMRKPVTVAAVLLLCFPPTYIIPVFISAFIASKIPLPKAFREKEER